MSSVRSREDQRRDQLEAAIAVLQQDYDSAPNPVFALDWEGRRTYANPAYSRLIARTAGSEDVHLYGDSGLPSAGTARDAPAAWSFDYRRWMADRLSRVLDAEILDHSVEAIRLILRHPVHGPVEALFTGRELRTAEGERLGWIGFAAGLDAPTRCRERQTSDIHACLLELHRALDTCRKRLEEPGSGPRPSRRTAARASLLTERESQVLDELLRGYRVPAIARRLSISPYTVRNHLKSVFKKVGVQSQGELVETLRRGS